MPVTVHAGHICTSSVSAVSVPLQSKPSTVQGIAMLNLGSTQVGMILLWGLFFYDIFWVFFTPVMVTVAKNIDGPIKLLFPATREWANFNMLGLGDIVIPGMSSPVY